MMCLVRSFKALNEMLINDCLESDLNLKPISSKLYQNLDIISTTFFADIDRAFLEMVIV